MSESGRPAARRTRIESTPTATAPLASPRDDRAGLRTVLRALAVSAAVLVASLALGGLTSLGQGALPGPINSLANSIGGWTMLTFFLVWLSRMRPLGGAILGLISFEALNEGYGIVSALRGYPYSAPFGTIWTLVGLLAGPIVGAAAAFTRHGRPDARVVGTSILSGILVAEGVWSLQRIADTTGPAYWILQLVAGVLFLVVAALVARPRIRGIVIALGLVGAAVAAYPPATDLLLR